MNGHRNPEARKAFGVSASRRAAMLGLSGAGIGALALLGNSQRVAAHGADEVAREAIEALGQSLATGDGSSLDAVFAADLATYPRHRLLSTGEEVSPDLEGLKAALTDIGGLARDVELTVDDLIAVEEKAAGRFSVRGTLAASGQSIEGDGLFFVVIADDLVTELWVYPDPYTTMAVMAAAQMATPAAAVGAASLGREVAVSGGGSYIDVDPDGLVAMLGAKTFPLVNVHIPYEGEIEGTDLFIPFDQIEQYLDQLPADPSARIVLYCRTGRMSAIAAETLVARGYSDVWNLAGGMVGWEQAGYSLVFAKQ
jgi:phage shock protein E